jgi:hypothetical protein
MARSKSFLKSLFVDCAKKSHNCQNDSNHRIQMGDIRLGLRVGRSPEYFCKECAIKFLEKNVEDIKKLIEELRN